LRRSTAGAGAVHWLPWSVAHCLLASRALGCHRHRAPGRQVLAATPRPKGQV
jgi:hypothetical protein